MNRVEAEIFRYYCNSDYHRSVDRNGFYIDINIISMQRDYVQKRVPGYSFRMQIRKITDSNVDTTCVYNLLNMSAVDTHRSPLNPPFLPVKGFRSIVPF